MAKALELERRQLLKLIAAAGAAGGSAWPAWAGPVFPRRLPAGTLMIGTGGAGCKVVRRAISFGFDPSGFVTIDSDPDELAASGATHQISGGQKRLDRPTFVEFDERIRAEGQINSLLQDAARVVIVCGLSSGIGSFWMMEMAGHLVLSHMAARGMTVEVVTTLPRADAGIDAWHSARMPLLHLRRWNEVQLRVGFDPVWPDRSRPSLGSLPERELWLTSQSLQSALNGAEARRSLPA